MQATEKKLDWLCWLSDDICVCQGFKCKRKNCNWTSLHLCLSSFVLKNASTLTTQFFFLKLATRCGKGAAESS